MKTQHTRQRGKQLERERVWQEKKREKRDRVLREKSKLLLSYYNKYISPKASSSTAEQLQAFYELQSAGVTDLQICIKIDQYEQKLKGSPGIDPVIACKKIWSAYHD